VSSNPLEQLTIEDLRTRTSMKWRTHPTDVLPLWVAEMDVTPAPAIIDAVTETMTAGDTGYPAGDAYARALGEFAAETWGWTDFQVERTAIVPDVMMGIVEVLRVLTDPGDAVIVTPPVYAPFYAFVEHSDRRIINAPLGDSNRLNIATLESAFVTASKDHKRAVLLLSNPHNPTGTVHTRAELEHVAQLARKYGVRVISDEIHAPLVYSGHQFIPFLTVDGAENAFSLTSASKAWNLAGLKAALVIAGKDSVRELAQIPEEVSHGPSHVAIIAHTAALNSGRQWLKDLLTGLEKNRNLLDQLISSKIPSVSWTPPQGTYLGWLDCRKLEIDEAPSRSETGVVSELAGPAQFFLSNAKVALSSGHVFGPGGRGHVRLNFATSPSVLTEAVTAMAESVRYR
jgi:cystathionine beta-lyase